MGNRISRKRIVTALASSVALLAIAAAQAATLEAQSKIDRVILYPDAALITRLVTLDVPAGSHEIAISDLPQGLDPASLRIEGNADQRLVIGGIDLKLRPASAKVEADLERKLRSLRAERDRILDRIDAVEGRKSMIQRLTQGGDGKDARPLDIEQYLNSADAVGKALLAANEELRVLRGDEERLNEDIAAVDLAIGQPDQRKPRRLAVVPVEASAASRVTIHVSYSIRGASWRPVYDARLDTRAAKPALELIRRALIRQTTGEDWSDASLTLSTLRVARGQAAPAFGSERAGFYERPFAVPVPAPMARQAPAGLEALATAVDEANKQRLRAQAQLALEETQAVAEVTAFQAEFLVPGRMALPSGQEEKSIRLGVEKLEPALRHTAVPVIDPTAYLEARFTWNGSAPLLAGEVLLTRDGAFIGRGRIRDIASGEETQLGFGADDKVKLSRVPVSREAREPGLLGSTKTDEYRFRIDVKNLHAFPVTISVLDRTPISEDQQITVERLSEMTKPDAENVEDKRGVFAWNATLKPQEAKSYLNAYRIRWPAAREIRITPLPR